MDTNTRCILEDIYIAINLEAIVCCTCDSEVGWKCERCFVIDTLENAKNLYVLSENKLSETNALLKELYDAMGASTTEMSARIRAYLEREE